MSSNADSKKQKAAVVDVDDDVDDLDDVLDQFHVPPKPTNPGQLASTPITPNTDKNAIDEYGGLPPEMAAELAAGMEEMFKNLGMAEGSSQGGGSAPQGTKDLGDEPLSEQEKAFRKLWEEMLVDGLDGKEDSKAGDQLDAMLLNAMGPSGPSGAKNADVSLSSQPKGPQSANDPFQEAIRQTMEKLKSSDESVTNEIDSSDPLAQLLSQLGDLSGEDADKMDGMIEEMLGAIMSKDVLYEPMKELSTSYPGYLSSHTDLPAADKKRYEEQLRLSKEILAIFDSPDYSDDNAKAQAEVFKLMNEMQSHGSPPPEVMGDLPEGMSAEGFAKGENCVIS